jgi:hypothetical protein
MKQQTRSSGKTCMAEALVGDGSGQPERAGAREWSRSTRETEGSRPVEDLEPRRHRSNDDDGSLRGRTSVNADVSNGRGRRSEETPGRCANSPGRCRSAQRGRRRRMAAVLEAFTAGLGDGIGETTVDWKSPGSIPCTGMKRATRRIFWCPRFGKGCAGAAAPWRGR